MAESKSDRFHCKINVHSEKLREFAPKCINILAPISEWSAPNERANGPHRGDRVAHQYARDNFVKLAMVTGRLGAATGFF